MNWLIRHLGVLGLCSMAGCSKFWCADLSTSNPERSSLVRQRIPAVDGKGGTMDHLEFAIIGDLSQADNSYDLATHIFMSLECEGVRPPFVIATGLGIPVAESLQLAGQRLEKFLLARQRFSNSVFFTLGQASCGGLNEKLCLQQLQRNAANLYGLLQEKLLLPNGVQLPYYALYFSGFQRLWTAKVVFVAPHVWSKAQALWLERILDDRTTYTFVVKDLPDLQADQQDPALEMIRRHDYTLLITGNAPAFHYEKTKKELQLGGLVPADHAEVLASQFKPRRRYGYILARQRPDLAIEFIAYDYATHRAGQHFAVHPDGALAELENW